MKKILFIAAHRPDRSPSQRFRFEQYLTFLKENGWDYDFSYLISTEDDAFFYKPGNYLKKISVVLRSFRKRRNDVKNANQYDIIFIQREAFMLGTTYFERKFSQSSAKVIFDFDDAIWHMDVSDGNKKFKFLKNPSKTEEIIRISDLIFAGNDYLAAYAKPFNSHCVIIPTTIDTKEYQRMEKIEKDSTICIGWSGSVTTIKHFEFALPALLKIKAHYGERVKIKVIGDGNYKNDALNVKGIAWTKAAEVKELSEFDIGIMPLPDDEWAKGKCGLKGLQYMALEIPTIMSPVGVNTEIIHDGENGFLAASTDEWVTKIAQLIESEALRIQLGKAARQTVVNQYSIEALKEEYLHQFNQLTSH